MLEAGQIHGLVIVKVPEDWPLHDPASLQVPEIELGLLTVAVLPVPVVPGMLIRASELLTIKVKLFPTMSSVLPLGVTPTVPCTLAPLLKHVFGVSNVTVPVTVAVVVVAPLVLLLVLFCESTTVKDGAWVPVVAVKATFQVPLTLALVPVESPQPPGRIANPTTNAVNHRFIIPNLLTSSGLLISVVFVPPDHPNIPDTRRKRNCACNPHRDWYLAQFQVKSAISNAPTRHFTRLALERTPIFQP
jgi:hypothetical protein